VFFIEELKSRKIVLFRVTANPNRIFVQTQLDEFMYDRDGTETHLIHDYSGELRCQDYSSFRITKVKIPAYAPNLNAFAERFVKSARWECFDHFIIFSQKQVHNLMKMYVHYYNHHRPHQSLGNAPPVPSEIGKGKIKKESVLFGLYTRFYRDAA